MNEEGVETTMSKEETETITITEEKGEKKKQSGAKLIREVINTLMEDYSRDKKVSPSTNDLVRVLLSTSDLSISQLKKEMRNVTDFLAESALKLEYTHRMQTALLSANSENLWKPAWKKAIKKWLSTISINSIILDDYSGEKNVELMLGPSVCLKISVDEDDDEDSDENSDDEDEENLKTWKVTVADKESKEIIFEIGDEHACSLKSLFKLYLRLRPQGSKPIPFNLWTSIMFRLLEEFGVPLSEIRLTGKPLKKMTNVWYIRPGHWHPAMINLFRSTVNKLDSESTMWVMLKWPRLIIGEERYKVQKRIQREIIFHTFTSLFRPRGRPGGELLLADIFSNLKINVDGKNKLNWHKKNQQHKFQLFLKKESFKVAIQLGGHWVHVQKVFRDGQVEEFPFQWKLRDDVEIPKFFIEQSQAEVLYFVHWFLLTSAELAVCFHNSVDKKFLDSQTSLGKIAHFREVQILLLPIFPKDIAGIILDYCHPNHTGNPPFDFAKGYVDLYTLASK